MRSQRGGIKAERKISRCPYFENKQELLFLTIIFNQFNTSSFDGYENIHIYDELLGRGYTELF